MVIWLVLARGNGGGTPRRGLLWISNVLLGRWALRGDLLGVCIVGLGWGALGVDLLRIRAVIQVLCSRRCVELRLTHWRTRVDSAGASGGFSDRSGPDTFATDGIDDGVQEDDIVVYERWGRNVSASIMTATRTVPQKKFKKENVSTTVNS